jgi:hypothetical protein
MMILAITLQEVGLQGSINVTRALITNTPEAGVLMMSWSADSVAVSIADSRVENVVRGCE